MSSLNTIVFTWVHNFSGKSPILDGLAVFFADWLAYFLVVGFLLLVTYQPERRRRLHLFCEGALSVILASGIIAVAIHYFYYQARPFVFYGISPLVSGYGPSFPSTHAAWFFALAMTVWFANRKWGFWYFILVILMGIARVYTGVHWPLDIIGGAVIGVASGIFIHRLLKPYTISE